MESWIRRKINSREGFTLIEIIVTLSIIGIIATGMIRLLGDVKNLQVKSKELDNINMMVSSYVETLRYEPEEAITEFGLRQVGDTDESKKVDKDGKLLEWSVKKNYDKEVYLNKKLEVVASDKATYKMTITLNGNCDKTGESSFIPDMHNRRFGKFKLLPTKEDYVFWIHSSLTSAQQQSGNNGYLNHNYEMLVISDLTGDGFEDFVVKWGGETHEKLVDQDNKYRTTLWNRDQSLGSFRGHIFREMLNYNKYEPEKFQYDVDHQIQNKVNVRGSIPVRLEFDDVPEGTGKYNLHIVNETPQALDFYLVGIESDPKVEVFNNRGLANITYLKPDRDEKSEYEFMIYVERLRDQARLVEYESGYYYAD